MFKEILKNVEEKTPLVHSITNYVTVNDCANIVLACGASPIMADDINEVCDITSICSSLVINMGTLNERTVASMLAGGKMANKLKHPVVFDPVGAGASAFRNSTALKLMEQINFDVIRGNISEIKFLATGGGKTQGVDACEADKISRENLDEVVSFAKSLSEKTGAVIAITGAIDVVADKNKAYIIENGHPLMSKITGTGCMLSCVVGGYIGANPNNILEATAAAVCAMGLCGQLGYEKMCEQGGGTNALRMNIIDFMSKMTGEILEAGGKIESK